MPTVDRSDLQPYVAAAWAFFFGVSSSATAVCCVRTTVTTVVYVVSSYTEYRLARMYTAILTAPCRGGEEVEAGGVSLSPRVSHRSVPFLNPSGMVCSGNAPYYRFCDVPWQYTGMEKTAGTVVEALQSLRVSLPSIGADCVLSFSPLLAKMCSVKPNCSV